MIEKLYQKLGRALLENCVIMTVFNCHEKYSHKGYKSSLIRIAVRIQFLTPVPIVVRMASDNTKKLPIIILTAVSNQSKNQLSRQFFGTVVRMAIFTVVLDGIAVKIAIFKIFFSV